MGNADRSGRQRHGRATPGDTSGHDKVRLEINWVQAAAGALAAMSSAVLLSTVGVAGTLIGAALGSVVFTVGSAIYSYSLRVSRARVAAAARLRAARYRDRDLGGDPLPPPVSPDVAPGPDPRPVGEPVGSAAGARQPGGPLTLRWRDALPKLPWVRIALGSAALFVVVMGVIVGVETLVGRPVSAYTGGSSSQRTGTSIPGLGGAGGTPSQTPAPTPSPGTATPTSGASTGPTPTTAPTPSASPDAPPTTASPAPEPTTSAPSVAPTPGAVTGAPAPSAPPS